MTNGHSAEAIEATTEWSEDARGPDIDTMVDRRYPKVPQDGAAWNQQELNEKQRQEEEWQNSDQKELERGNPSITKKEFLTKLVKDHNLIREEDIWHNKQLGFAIIKLSGIEKIQSNLNINVTFEDRVLSPTYAAIKAIATIQKSTSPFDSLNERVESYGTCTQGTKNTNPKGDHPGTYIAEMAEKRAKGRAVLKLCGAYKWGVKSEDESPDFKKDT
jgi:hypothetical protein